MILSSGMINVNLNIMITFSLFDLCCKPNDLIFTWLQEKGNAKQEVSGKMQSV